MMAGIMSIAAISSSVNQGDVSPLRHDVEYTLYRFGGLPSLGYAQNSLTPVLVIKSLGAVAMSGVKNRDLFPFVEAVVQRDL